jgi:hypothetical protein
MDETRVMGDEIGRVVAPTDGEIDGKIDVYGSIGKNWLCEERDDRLECADRVAVSLRKEG